MRLLLLVTSHHVKAAVTHVINMDWFSRSVEEQEAMKKKNGLFNLKPPKRSRVNDVCYFSILRLFRTSTLCVKNFEFQFIGCFHYLRDLKGYIYTKSQVTVSFFIHCYIFECCGMKNFLSAI